MGDLGPATDWSVALRGVTEVIHCAGRAHVLRETSRNPLQSYLEANALGTRRLAEQAGRCGVRRIVFLSSIGVLGSTTNGRGAFVPTDVPAPTEPYAVSKFQAERHLESVANDCNLEYVILRPPLVYGPGVGANFRRLIGLAGTPWPLPFGACHNKKSFVALPNLVDVVLLCLDDKRANRKTILVADGADVTLAELLTRIRAMFGMSSRMLSVPPQFLEAGARVFGFESEFRKLVCSLQVSIAETKAILDWSPRADLWTVLDQTVQFEIAVRRGPKRRYASIPFREAN